MSGVLVEDDDLPVEVPEKDLPPVGEPTEYLPVMRHHLAEALHVLESAYGKAAAEDLAEGYRNARPFSTAPLTRRIDRSIGTLMGYLGMLDAEEESEDGQA